MNASRSAQVLAIDTSGSFCCVALRTGDGSILHRESDGAGDHFERISSLVTEVLRLGGVVVEDLGHIRIGVGPGSFTGLRIGMSFAKGMAVAAQIPLVGVSSFAGVAQVIAAHGEHTTVERVLVIADARREEVFAAEFSVDVTGVREVSPPRIESALWVSQWAFQHPTGVVATPNVGFYVADGVYLHVESNIAKGLLLLDVEPPPVFSVAGVSDLEPNYLRAVAAKSIEERRGG